MIRLEHVTLRYPGGKGISDISFSVKEGRVTGYLGPNGAGKTTTIRCLMGFMKPDGGSCTIRGMDCFREGTAIKRFLGYIPGEIAFPKGMSCREYLKYQCDLRGVKDTSRMRELMERFELPSKGTMKQFSKGMKQKVGIVAAFLHDPEVLILDEPTSGLDPLMQNEFIRLILEEKKRGKTILLSSHMFEEVERTCDDVVIIREGQIAARADTEELTSSRRKGYVVRTPELARLKAFGFPVGEETEESCVVYVRGSETDAFFKQLAAITVLDFDTKTQTLEDIFLQYYESGEKSHESDDF